MRDRREDATNSKRALGRVASGTARGVSPGSVTKLGGTRYDGRPTPSELEAELQPPPRHR
jgi:hypothetical protein